MQSVNNFLIDIKNGNDRLSQLISAVDFQEYRPAGKLARYVRSIFYFDFSLNITDPLCRLAYPKKEGRMFERLIPSGCADLIIQSEQSFCMILPGFKSEVLLPKTFVASVMSGHVELRQTANVKLFGVRLHPWATGSFVKNRAAQNPRPHVTDGSSVLYNRAAVEIRSRLFNDGFREGFTHLEYWLNEYMNVHGETDDVVNDAVQMMIEKKGVVEMNEIYKKNKITVRRIEQRFSDCIGMCPKHYSRLIKFQSIFSALNAGKAGSLADIVYACGYYDQSHLIRNFREFAGTTPKKYFKENNLISGLLSSKDAVSFLMNS